MRARSARAHLENCTGKTFERSGSRGGFQSEAAEAETHKRIRLSFHLNSLRSGMIAKARSSEEERRVDAKALIADEGRDKLR